MAHTDYPINFHILAEDFRGKQVTGYSQSEAAWLHESLSKMCEAYDAIVDEQITDDELDAAWSAWIEKWVTSSGRDAMRVALEAFINHRTNDKE